MAKDVRLKYVRKWIRQARSSADPYDIFISFWTALTIAAQIHRPKHRLYHKEEDTNRERILDYFVKNKKEVFEAVKKNRDIMVKITQMEGPKYKDPIIDTGDPEQRVRFSELVRYYSGKIRSFSQRRMAENMAELVCRARYSLFRTRKTHDANYDRALLKLLNPIVADILKACREDVKHD